MYKFLKRSTSLMAITTVTPMCSVNVKTLHCGVQLNNGCRDLLTSPHRQAECRFLLAFNGQAIQNSDNCRETACSRNCETELAFDVGRYDPYMSHYREAQLRFLTVLKEPTIQKQAHITSKCTASKRRDAFNEEIV